MEKLGLPSRDIRRMVLKRCIYGVDKNPLTVELAKVSLWLHSFTVGAPLSFLDHHLRCGDTLIGLSVSDALRDLRELGGGLFAGSAVAGAEKATDSMQLIEEKSDADIAEVQESALLFHGVMEPFARDLGYDDSPFIWDEEERRHLRARLDALYFHLYGLSREDAEYVLSTFPIVRKEDEATFGKYRTRDLILAYMNALAAGDTESVVAV